MMTPSTGIKRSQYSLLGDKDVDSVPASRRQNILAASSRLSKSSLTTVFVLSLSTITGIGGYFLGGRFELRKSESLFHCKLSSTRFKFVLNRY